MSPRQSSANSWLWPAGGFLLGLGIVSLPSIGLLVLPVAAATLVAAAAWGRGKDATLALVGAGLPFLYVAFLHRGGPGQRCGQTDTGGWCQDLLDPRPWLLIGLALVGLGLGLFLRVRSRPRRPTS